MSRVSSVLQGLRDAMPIITAYFPVAITFGILCTSAGLPWSIACLISLVVYAGGAQFMLVALAAAGTSPISTVITVLLVNVRHVLYGTTLAQTFASWSARHRWTMAFGLTDEVFAVTSSRLLGATNKARDRALPAPPAPAYQIPFAYGCYASWVIGTALGAGLGRIVPESWTNVLEYALPALFIALLFLGVRSASHMLAAICGGAVACVADLLHWSSLGMVAGAVVGASAGYAASLRFRTRLATAKTET